tara:strand:+ start:9073 stop:9390 length:318 start_codon:yes stop_codon:yes gene_type:complete
MVLTRGFSETIKARAEREPAFRAALFEEAISLLLEGDVTTGKAVIRDYINATVGFEALALKVETPVPSLMRMFSAKGNPTATKLFSVIKKLQDETGVEVGLTVTG